MGAGASIVPEDVLEDDKVKICMREVPLSDSDVQKLYILFHKCSQGTETISADDIFRKMLDVPEDCRFVYDSYLAFMEPEKAGKVTFGEFVDFVCTFCKRATRQDMLIIALKHIEWHDLECVDEDALRIFLLDTHGKNSMMKRTIDLAIKEIKRTNRVDGKHSFEACFALEKKFSAIYWPCFRGISELRAITLGEFRWNRKELLYPSGVPDSSPASDSANVAQAQEEAQLREQMGALYYITPWKRDYYRNKRKRLLELSADLDREASRELQLAELRGIDPRTGRKKKPPITNAGAVASTGAGAGAGTKAPLAYNADDQRTLQVAVPVATPVVE
jgi:hypothetical protein